MSALALVSRWQSGNPNKRRTKMSDVLSWTVLAMAGKVKPVALASKVSASMSGGKITKS